MFSKIWLINILLAVCVSFFGIKAYGVWSGEKEPVLEMQHVETRPERTEVKPEEAKKSPEAKPKDSKGDKLLMAALKKIVL